MAVNWSTEAAAAPQLDDDDDGDHQQATTAAVLFLEFTSPLLLLSHALHTIVVLPENGRGSVPVQ